MQWALPVPGDVVWIRQQRWRVERAHGDRHVARLDVAARDRRLTFLLPFDRPAPQGRRRPRRIRAQQALARVAHLIARTSAARLPLAALDARADILPYQLEPALAILAGCSRLLVADEVGLGKTVQAGLVIAELVRRETGPRVLVIAPAALRDQWVDELTLRFRLAVAAADRAGLDEAARDGAFGSSPWDRSGIWIVSPDFLKQTHVFDALPVDPWDLVVIDEAHAVCGDSDRYAACEAVSSRARRVLLLTATPHEGDATRFARLVSLGAADSDAPPTIFRRTRADVGLPVTRRVRWHLVAASLEETRVLDELRAFERRVLAAGGANRDRTLLLLSVFRKRALSTMAALSCSISRRLAWLGEPAPATALDWTQPPLAFDDRDADDVGDAERAGLSADTGLDGRRERSWLRRLRQLSDDCARRDHKIARLQSLLARAAEPVVIFTEFRDSLTAIARRLEPFAAMSILHGGQTPAERRQELQRFLQGSSSVLLATDVAGQGLNLQHRARWVVSLELPWNPARLEQRVGRVDRLGQTRPVHFTLLISRDASEANLLRHLSRRVMTARLALGDGTLASLAPPETSVARALLLNAPLAIADPGTPARLCRSWTRPATTIANALIRRRALAACWRPDNAESSGPIWTDAGRAARLLPQGRGTCLFYSVPFVTDDDELVDRQVVAVATPVPAHASDAPAARAAIAQALTTLIRRRLARIQRTQRIVSAAAIRRERALTRARARSRGRHLEAQPRLFDRQAIREFDAERAAGAQAAHAAGARIDRLARQAHVRAGAPVLELVLVGRR